MRGFCQGFCERCANNKESWFCGEEQRIRCAQLGIINRRDVRLRCGYWLDGDSVQLEPDPVNPKQATLFD